MVNGTSKQKLRGGYYTPEEIVTFLVEWAIAGKNTTVLEPCFGDGNFLESICKKFAELKVKNSEIKNKLYGTELNKEEYNKAIKRVSTLFDCDIEFPGLKQGDFFLNYEQVFKNIKFDAIVGNPPFIRYQNFEPQYSDRAFKIMKSAGLHPNRLTNAWAPFLLSSALLLKDTGRIAMVIPAEIMQVNYAAELRLFLSEFFNAITLITFEEILFPGIQQEVVLFLGEKEPNGHGINVVHLKNEKCLRGYIHKLPTKKDCKPIDHTKDKWTQYYLTKEEIFFLRKIKNDSRLKRFGELAEVDVGIVTGINEFFLVNKDQIDKFGLRDYVSPLVGRTSQIEGLIFTKKDWKKNDENNLKTHLLNIPFNSNGDLPEKVKSYIRLGEKMKYNEGYKCRIRTSWYAVPSVWVSDAFLFRQIHDFPKLILNQARVLTTDTIHRVRFKEKINPRTLCVSFHNSLTFAFSEIMGRSYGGGVLELEPTEAEGLPIPYFNISEKLVDKMDLLIRKNDIKKLLSFTDDLLLKKKLGFKDREIKMLTSIWEKLSARRMNRKSRN